MGKLFDRPGMIVWGIGMGAQESVVKAAVADLIPHEKRGTAYGVFNTFFGVSWFAGSAHMGYLYDVSITGLILFSVIAQLIAFVILWIFTARKNQKNESAAGAD